MQVYFCAPYIEKVLFLQDYILINFKNENKPIENQTTSMYRYINNLIRIAKK